MPIYQRGETTESITLPDGRAVTRVYANGDLVFGEAAVNPAPMRGGGLTAIQDGALLITNALGGDAGSGTPGSRTVAGSPFGSRYPAYGGQTATSGGAFNMSMITVNGGNFGNTVGVSLSQFEAASTVTTTFPAGEGDPHSSGNGFNTAMGVSGTAPSTNGVYDINVELDTGEIGLYQLEVGGGGGTTTHTTPVNLSVEGTATIFQNSFIFGARAGNTQAFTLGPATDNTSADCFIALNLPADLDTVAVSLTPATAPISFAYSGFSGNIRWFGFRGIPSELGTGAHTLTVNGVATNTGPPLISAFNGRITGVTSPAGADTTVSLDFTIGAIGGSAITEVTYTGGGVTTTLTEPAGGWVVGDYSFTNVPARLSQVGGILSNMSATNSDGTFTTINTTFVA